MRREYAKSHDTKMHPTLYDISMQSSRTQPTS